MAHDTMSGGDRQHQQTGQYRMFKCKDCGAEFSAPNDKRPRFCPECRKKHHREEGRLYRAARKPGKLLAARRDAFLARRDALYDAAHFPAPVVRVSNGLRIETRGNVAGSVRSC